MEAAHCGRENPHLQKASLLGEQLGDYLHHEVLVLPLGVGETHLDVAHNSKLFILGRLEWTEEEKVFNTLLFGHEFCSEWHYDRVEF